MNSSNDKLSLMVSVDFGTSFTGVAWRCCNMEVPMAVPAAFRDALTRYTRFPMPTGFQRCANLNLTPSGARSRLLGSSTEDVPTYPVASIDNVKSNIHAADRQDHHLLITADQWTLACALIDLASWAVLSEPQISRLLIICSNMEQSLTLDPASTAPPPTSTPTQWKEHSPEPQRAVIPRSCPSSSVLSLPQHHHHQQ